MDRRQRKTRQAIFSAFTELLSGRNLSGITVGEIIEKADIGRATFYAHFETKDALLDEYCKELFCHIFDAADGHAERHTHIFDCEDTDSPFLHLFRHLYNNDNNIAKLLAGKNNEVFLLYFKKGLWSLVEGNFRLFDCERLKNLPRDFVINHICSTFVETVKWWFMNNKTDSPEKIHEYFITLLTK